MHYLLLGCALLLSYFCGAIPFGVIIGKMRGIDVRAVGSGNIGTTNVWRALGPGAGTVVFILDVLKGLAGPWFGRALLGADNYVVIALCALIAVLGHTFSVFLGFKGGKGIATGLGVAVGLSPVPALLVFALWGVVLLGTRMISAASIAACVALPIAYLIVGAHWSYIAVVGLIVTVALVKHIPNMKRIKAGTEPKINLRKKQSVQSAADTSIDSRERTPVVEPRSETVTGK